jgi:3-methyladenine DNA glycosylase AlkD
MEGTMRAASKAKSKTADVASVMEELKAKGKESAAKTYQRHGVTEETFGVSYADLGVFEKRLGTHHELALGLWETGVHDARVLATKVADPEKMTRREIERWLGSASHYVITDALSMLAGRMPAAREMALAWIDDPGEWISTAGWSVLAMKATEGAFEAAEVKTLLGRIRKDIHRAKNRTRYAMNNALISIGGSIEAARDAALQAAQAIGKVEVDHGETGCKTPDAVSYIAKMVAHQSARTGASKAKPASRTIRTAGKSQRD